MREREREEREVGERERGERENSDGTKDVRILGQGEAEERWGTGNDRSALLRNMGFITLHTCIMIP